MVVEAPPAKVAKPTIVEEAWDTKPLVKVERPETFKLVKEPAPEAETKQLPVIAKHPFVRLIPFANVDVAPVTERVPVWIPPAKVEVEMLVIMRALAVVVPKVAVVLAALTDPPVMVKPLEVERPAADRPPANVDVPCPAPTVIAPVKVEVAVPVTERLASVVVASCERPLTARAV